MLTAGQYRALSYLRDHPGATTPDVFASCDLSNGAHVLAGLYTRRLANRVNKGKGAAVLFSWFITEAGMDLLAVAR